MSADLNSYLANTLKELNENYRLSGKIISQNE